MSNLILCTLSVYAVTVQYSNSGSQLTVSLFKWLSLKKQCYWSHIIPAHDFTNANPTNAALSLLLHSEAAMHLRAVDKRVALDFT